MKTNTILTIIAASITLLTGCSTSDFTLAGRKFRTIGAPTTKLGMTGFKHRAGHNSIYSTEYRPDYLRNPEAKLAVSVVTRQHTEITGSTAAEVTAKPTVAVAGTGLAGASAKGKWEETLNGDFDLVIAEESIAHRLNLPSNRPVLEELARWGKEARVVTAIALAYSHESKHKTTTDSEVTGTISPATGKVAVKTEKGRIIQFSDGSVYAYEMARPAWEKGPDGKPRIASLIPDRFGLGGMRMPGTEWDPAKLK